jgi:hypothetical protein
LNKLQLEGLVINGIHLTFSFSTLVADNLAAHLIGGFQMSFSNGFFCRRCYITYAEKNLPIAFTRMGSRTICDHDDIVQEINNNPTKSPLMGVIGQSPIHNLIGFHPITSLPGDLMHDFIEGVCPIVIIALLKQASSMRLILFLVEKSPVRINCLFDCLCVRRVKKTSEVKRSKSRCFMLFPRL